MHASVAWKIAEYQRVQAARLDGALSTDDEEGLPDIYIRPIGEIGRSVGVPGRSLIGPLNTAQKEH